MRRESKLLSQFPVEMQDALSLYLTSPYDLQDAPVAKEVPIYKRNIGFRYK